MGKNRNRHHRHIHILHQPAINDLSLSKNRQRRAKVAPVVLILQQSLTAAANHIDRSLGAQPKDIDIARALNLVDMFLAVLADHTLLRIVVEEAVRARAVVPDALGVNDAHGPGRRHVGHVRVEVLVVLGEGDVSLGVGLVVGRLGLNRAVPDVLCVLELVLGELRVLRSGADEPDGALGLDEHAAAVVDVDLRVVLLVELVVGCPEPNVLEVAVGLLGDVKLHEGANAFGVGLVNGSGVLLAVGGLEVGACETADTEVNIPETGFAGFSCDVPFHEDAAGSRALSGDDGVRHFEATLVTALLADTETGLGIVHLGEKVAGDEEHGENLANNLDVLLGRDVDGLLDEVSTVVDVEDLAVLKTVDGSLDRGSVVGLTVTLGALGLEADKLRHIDVLVLRLAALEPTVLTEKGLRLDRSTVDITLDTTSSSLASSHGVTLGPGGDLLLTSKECLTSNVLDSSVATLEVDIVDDECATGVGDAVRSERSVDTNGSVGKLAVEKEDGADGLVGGAVSHVETELAVVDEDALQRPQPVPVHENGSTAAVEGHVASSELLRTEEGSDGATVEGQVRHESSRAVILEDTLLLGTSLALGHLKPEVLERGGLRNLPVNTSGDLGGGDVDDKVADLAVEVVLIGEPVGAIATGDIRIRINQAHALEAGRGLQCGQVGGITNELSVVILNDRLADDVGTGREVDDGGSGSRRVAALAATAAVGNDFVDNIGVIGDTIALSSEVLDIAENLVASGVGVEGRLSLALDAAEPVARRTGLRCWSCLGNRCCGGGGSRKQDAQRQKERTSAEGNHDGCASIVLKIR